MAETKLEYALQARLLPKILCNCERPIAELYVAQVLFTKCVKCGRAYSKSITLKEAIKYKMILYVFKFLRYIM